MLDSISFAQKQRLAYIDFCLLFKGAIYRQDLINRFQVGLSAGSRDFNIYKELAPDNLSYDSREKRYFQTPQFKPVFEHDARRTLTKLANDISDGFDAIGDIHFPVEAPTSLNVPDIFIVARLVQAILNNKAVSVIYTSLSSGSNARELVPHSIVYKLTKGNAPDTAQMNAKVREMITEALKADGVEEIFKLGQGQDGIDIFDDDYLAKIEKIKQPNTKIQLLQQMLAKALGEFKKVNKTKAFDFSERFKSLVEKYNE